MEVEDDLAPSPVDVYKKPIPRLGNSVLLRDLPGHRADVRKDTVSFGKIVQGWDVYAGNDEDVNRSNRVRVMERYDEIVFVHPFRGSSARDDFTENAITH